jgi:hypothetical protein
MSRSLRRYEILLPLRFNDGESVPDDFVADTLLELEQRFGAVSSETQTIRGLWRHEGESYRDDLIRVFVDVADLPDHRQFIQLGRSLPCLRHSMFTLSRACRLGRAAAPGGTGRSSRPAKCVRRNRHAKGVAPSSPPSWCGRPCWRP